MNRSHAGEGERNLGDTVSGGREDAEVWEGGDVFRNLWDLIVAEIESLEVLKAEYLKYCQLSFQRGCHEGLRLVGTP